MEKYIVPVSFRGEVEVFVPNGITSEQKKALAEKVAHARILATLDNPDAPEQEACDEYAEQFQISDEVAGGHWDDCKTGSYGGAWTVGSARNK